MDKLIQYRKIIKNVLREIATYGTPDEGVEREVVVDESLDHFELMTCGWSNDRRIHGCLVHIDIRNEKIWIQYDGIEGGVTCRLVDAGVPKSDIVLGFHSPFKRKFTEYAVG